MSDRALRPPKDWPPLIVAGTKPRWVMVRDIALTVLMWVLFAIMLETEFELFFGRYLVRLGFGEFDVQANWGEFFEALRPFLRIAYVLIALLIVASFLTLRRIARTRRLPEPPPLPIADEARRVGMDEAELLAARELRVVVIHIDAAGRHRVAK
jgi:poly-beta-1,6-N-acetyl-D-glucosamine biosynthesis protein PgaD